ncbi:MAG: SIS domain-containing protein [Spirochaetia bacterium]
MNKEIISKLTGRYPELSDFIGSIIGITEGIIAGYEKGGKLLVCGNGGSAADADHIVGELMKGFERKRPLPEDFFSAAGAGTDEDELSYLAEHLQEGLPAINLSAHTSLSTAFSNDAAPDLVFAQGVAGYGKPEDTLLCLSTSGNSANTVYAAITAGAVGIRVFSLTGPNASRLSEISEITVRVPGKSTAEVQEYHLPVYHAVCRCIEDHFFSS